MSFLLHLVQKLPLPMGTGLAWQRSLLDRAFRTEVATARKFNDAEKIHSLKSDHRLEIDFQDEDEDAYLTSQLLVKARRLRVPVPRRYNEDKTESDHWYEGQYTGGWYLTNHGIAALRAEIRSELKARHESRAHWVVWLSALTGVLGAVTGLVALLSQRLS